MQGREAIALAHISRLLLQTLHGVKRETEMAFGYEGYENMVRNVVDPPADPEAEAPDASPGDPLLAPPNPLRKLARLPSLV